MTKHITASVLRVLFCSTSLLAVAPAVMADEYPSYMSIGGKVGSDRSIGETQLFLPLRQDDDHMVFADLRFKRDSTHAWEGNAGLAYRAVINDDFIVGGYGFFDYKDTTFGNSMRQATLGAELLTENQDFRANIYIPERDKKLASSSSALVQTGTQLFFENSQTFERGAPGADIEFGQRLPFKAADIRVYGAAYHFFLDQSDDMNGVRGRVRWQTDPVYIYDQPINFRVSAEAQHDNIRGGTEFAGLEVVIPFGKTASYKSGYSNPVHRRMIEPIIRDVDIVTHAAKQAPQKEAAVMNIGSDHFSQVHVLLDQDATTLNTSLSNLPDNTAIILNNGSSVLIDTTLTPKSNQTLIGSNNNVTVSGSKSNQSAKVSTTRTELVKSNSLSNATPLISLASGSKTKLIDLDLRTESGNKGNDIIMVSNNGQPIDSLSLVNVNSDGVIVVDTSTGSSTVDIHGGEYNGVVLRTRGTADMHASLQNATFKRSYSTAESFPQNITSLVLIEGMGTSSLTIDQIRNNQFIDDVAKTGGRAALGLGFVNSSTTAMQVNNLIDNTVSRTQGTWDAGAILGQGTGGRLIMFNNIHGNVADPFESINIRVNIGQAGYTGDEAGFEAANPGTDIINYGNVQFTNNF